METGRSAVADRDWITRAEFARRLGIHQRQVAKVVEAGGVRVKALPGLMPRYRSEDVDRIAAGAVKEPSTT